MGGWVVKKVQNSVYVVIECPLTIIACFCGMMFVSETTKVYYFFTEY